MKLSIMSLLTQVDFNTSVLAKIYCNKKEKRHQTNKTVIFAIITLGSSKNVLYTFNSPFPPLQSTCRYLGLEGSYPGPQLWSRKIWCSKPLKNCRHC